jgi:hypothetical protein
VIVPSGSHLAYAHPARSPMSSKCCSAIVQSLGLSGVHKVTKFIERRHPSTNMKQRSFGFCNGDLTDLLYQVEC